MKKVRTTIAAIALIAITAGATFAANTTQKSAAAINDCWSSVERLQNNLPPDVDQQSDCPALDGECCYKPEGTFGFDQI